MPKHLLEDMVPAKHERKEVTKIQFKQKEIQEDVRVGEAEINYSKGRSRKLLWFVAFVSIIFCFFAISFLFSKAEIMVNPKTQDVILNQNLSASKDSNNDSLSFRLMVVSDEENKTIQATEKKDLAVKATGTVLIFNSFNSSPQTLSVDTRLEGSNGKIYKTQAKSIVPGMGQDGTPGKVEVGIYAAEAGEEYNSAPLDFTLLGFKDTPKYSKFIGRSKTGTEITGGFKGKAPAISDADKVTAVGNLKNILQAQLLQKSTDHPDNFILFKDAIFINTDDANILSTYNKDNSLTLTLKGTLYGFLFSEQKLTENIAKNNIEKYDGSEIYIPNIGDLTFALADKDKISFGDVQNINFSLSGSAKIVWRLDVNKFIADLLGRSKKDFNQMLSQYPNISSANLTLTPMWKMSIPDKIKNINVIVNYPK